MDDAKRAQRLVKGISPLLTGHPPQIQSAALGELVSMFLAGHFVLDPETGQIDADKTDEMRQTILEGIVKLALTMLPINHAIVIERHKDRFRDRSAKPNVKRR